MSKQKDSAFYNRKAQVLRDLGIEATPVKDLVTVDITFNENHVKSAAEGKGMSVDKFMADIDAQAEGKEDATMPGVPRRDLDDAKAETKGEAASEEKVAPKASNKAKKASKPKVVTKAEDKPEVEKEPEVKPEDKV